MSYQKRSVLKLQAYRFIDEVRSGNRLCPTAPDDCWECKAVKRCEAMRYVKEIEQIPRQRTRQDREVSGELSECRMTSINEVEFGSTGKTDYVNFLA